MDSFKQDNHMYQSVSKQPYTYTHSYTHIQTVCCNFKTAHTKTKFAQYFTGSDDGINHEIFRNKLYLYVAIKIST